MATKLSIINLAFAHLSESLVQTLGGDPAPPNVVKALAQWDQALDVCLSAAPWLCAHESLTIERSAASGDWRYPSLFVCPTGTLRVFAVQGYDGVAWQAGATVDNAGAVKRVIKSVAAGPLYVDLILRRPVEALTPLLADALAWELAGRLAGPIQSSEDKAAWCMKKAEGAYAAAISAEATEIGGQEPLIGLGSLAYARMSAG